MAVGQLILVGALARVLRIKEGRLARTINQVQLCQSKARVVTMVPLAHIPLTVIIMIIMRALVMRQRTITARHSTNRTSLFLAQIARDQREQAAAMISPLQLVTFILEVLLVLKVKAVAALVHKEV